MTGSCPVGADVCRETAHERKRLRQWKAEARYCSGRCYDDCRHACRRSGPHAEHECVNGHTVAVDPDDDQPESTLRYVTAWEPDTRTPQQRSDHAIDELRRRLTGGA